MASAKNKIHTSKVVLDISSASRYENQIIGRKAGSRKMAIKASRFARRSLLALCLSVIAATVLAQAAQEGYQPQVGQEGKDVVWVQTPQAPVEKMIDNAKTPPKE